MEQSTDAQLSHVTVSAPGQTATDSPYACATLPYAGSSAEARKLMMRVLLSHWRSDPSLTRWAWSVRAVHNQDPGLTLLPLCGKHILLNDAYHYAALAD